MFGASSTPSLFGGSGTAFGASSSSLFGQSTAGFGTFGQSSTTFGGFGQSSTAFGGFGQASTGFGGFGQSSAGFGGFGQSSTGFGGLGQSSSVFSGFGQSNPGFGAFGQSSSVFGGFGQSSTGFGALGQSAPAFGFTAAGSTPAFGFGQPFGAASSMPGFGVSSSPSFGQPAFGNQPGFFGGSNPASSIFSSSSGFGNLSGGWGVGAQGQDQSQQISSREQQEFLKLLCRKDERPLTSHTKFRDLQDGGQSALQKIEQELGICKKLSKELQCHKRLCDSGQFQKEFDAEVASIKRVIGQTKTSVTTEWSNLEHLKPIEEWLHAATYDASALCQRGQIWKKGKQEPNTHNSLGYIHKDLSAVAELPNRHLFLCVDELRGVTERLSNWLSALEDLHTHGQESGSSPQEVEPMLQNMHAYFVHVANKIEKLFAQVEQMKRECLRSFERQGRTDNPFQEAEEEERNREKTQKIPKPAQVRMQNMTPTLPMFQATAQQQSGPQPMFGGGNAPSSGLFNAPQGPSFGGAGMFGAQSSGMGFAQPGTAGLFGQSSTATSFGGGVFGQSSAAPGFGGNIFGQSSGTSGLGGSSSTANLFAQPSGASLFGQSSGAGGSGVGAFGGGFGLASNSGAADKLGQTSSFGFGSFGNSGANIFATPQRNNKPRAGRRR